MASSSIDFIIGNNFLLRVGIARRAEPTLHGTDDGEADERPRLFRGRDADVIAVGDRRTTNVET